MSISHAIVLDNTIILTSAWAKLHCLQTFECLAIGCITWKKRASLNMIHNYHMSLLQGLTIIGNMCTNNPSSWILQSKYSLRLGRNDSKHNISVIPSITISLIPPHPSPPPLENSHISHKKGKETSSSNHWFSGEISAFIRSLMFFVLPDYMVTWSYMSRELLLHVARS